MRRNRELCVIHLEEAGEERDAVMTLDCHGPVCEECLRDIGQAEGAERRNAAQYAYAAGYHN